MGDPSEKSLKSIKLHHWRQVEEEMSPSTSDPTCSLPLDQ
jgi:hypothetical protein